MLFYFRLPIEWAIGDEPSPLHLWQPEKLFVRFRLPKRGRDGGWPEMLFRAATAFWQAVFWFLKMVGCCFRLLWMRIGRLKTFDAVSFQAAY